MRCSFRWGPLYDDDSMTTMLPDEPPVPAAVQKVHGPPGRLGLLVLVFVGFISLGLPGRPARRWLAIDSARVRALAGCARPIAHHDDDRLFAGQPRQRLDRRADRHRAIAGAQLSADGGWPVRLRARAGLAGDGEPWGGGPGSAPARSTPASTGYVALHHSPRLLNWLHACFGIGAATGPAIMTAVLQAGHSWRLGYAIVGSVQLGLGICFLLTLKLWPDRSSHPHETSTLTPTLSLWERESSAPPLLLAREGGRPSPPSQGVHWTPDLRSHGAPQSPRPQPSPRGRGGVAACLWWCSACCSSSCTRASRRRPASGRTACSWKAAPWSPRRQACG